MTSYLSDADLLALIPEHLRDSQFEASIKAIQPYLRRLALSIPNLLIYARMGKPSTMLPPLERLTQARGGLKKPETELLEKLAWQFHVDFRETAENDSQLAEMVLNSIAWHRKKGTPASIKAALKLFNLGSLKIEEDGVGDRWAEYQVDVPDGCDLETLARVVKICREMQPARCKLWRMYSDSYDWRQAVWSGGAPENSWSNSWWGMYSGTKLPDFDADPDLVVSFGQRKGFHIEQYSKGKRVSFAALQYLATIIRYLDHMIWGYSRWGDAIVKPTQFLVTGWMASQAARIFLPMQHSWHGFNKTESVWSNPAESDEAGYFDGVWGEINSNYSTPVSTVYGEEHPVWGQAKWSDRKNWLYQRFVVKQTRQFRKYLANALQPATEIPFKGLQLYRNFIQHNDHSVWGQTAWGDSFPTLHGFTGLIFGYFHPLVEIHYKYGWSGNWDDRRWKEIDWLGMPHPPHKLLWHGFTKSENVWSNPSESQETGYRDGVWGEINSNYGQPKDGSIEQKRDERKTTFQRINPQDALARCTVISRHRVAKNDYPVWGENAWGDTFPDLSKKYGVQWQECHRIDASREPNQLVCNAYKMRNWEGAWDERTWQDEFVAIQ